MVHSIEEVLDYCAIQFQWTNGLLIAVICAFALATVYFYRRWKEQERINDEIWRDVDHIYYMLEQRDENR